MAYVRLWEDNAIYNLTIYGLRLIERLNNLRFGYRRAQKLSNHQIANKL